MNYFHLYQIDLLMTANISNKRYKRLLFNALHQFI
jgi:hypothetical protein